MSESKFFQRIEKSHSDHHKLMGVGFLVFKHYKI